MANKIVTLVPVTTAQLIGSTTSPAGGGVFNVTTQYWVVDDGGNKWKQGSYNYTVSDTSQTLLTIITTALAGINAQEGLS